MDPRVWGENLLFGKIFVNSCIKKMKEIQPKGERALDLPTDDFLLKIA